MVVSPKEEENALWINQDAVFSLGDFEPGKQFEYEIKISGNGVYVFVIEGSVIIGDNTLNKRDGLGVYNTSSITIETEAESRLLIMDIPML